MIKIQLYHATAGTLTVSPDAEGTDDFEQTLKRSEATDGVIYEYSLDLQFTKMARRYLRDIFQASGGIEALVVVNAFEYAPNAFKWEQIATGTVKFLNSSLKAETYKTSIEQVGLIRKVMNLMDTDLDLDTEVSQGGVALPETPTVDMTLHSKIIIKETLSEPAEMVEFQQLDVFEQSNIPGEQTTYRERITFGNFATDKQVLNELADSFQYPFGWRDTGLGMALEGPASVPQMITYLQGVATKPFRLEIYKAKEAGVLDVELTLKVKHEVIANNDSGDIDVCGDGALGTIEIHAWFERRDANDNILEIVHIGEFTMPQCGEPGNDGNTSTGVFETKVYSNLNIAVSVGHKIYVYETVRVYAHYENTDAGDERVTHHYRITPQAGYSIKLKSDTVTPPSTAKTYMIHEALKKMFQFYTDQADPFRSEYFGRTDSEPAYAEDGRGSLRAIASGANIRKVLGRTTFVNGNDFYGAMNAIDCLGMGFEIRDGKQVVVINPLEYFYNKNQLILDLGVVSDLEMIPDVKAYANQMELAYGKIDIQKTNGIDEFATGYRRFKYPVTQVSNKHLASTKYKASGAEIEDQRRKIGSTEDAKNDENNFIFDCVRDGLTFKPRRMEGFTLVENLFSPETSYNLNLSHRRNLDNWLPVVAMPLYLSANKIITFSAGEGNYTMRTQKTGEAAPKEENGPVDVTGIEPLWAPERYKFNSRLSADQMKIIRQFPYGYFIFQEFRGGPNLEGYLSKVTRSAKKKTAQFETLKVFRPNG